MTERRRHLAACVVLALALMAVLGPAADSVQAAARPNVVVVMTDDQDRRSLSAMPTVKRDLRRRGTTFRNFLATFPTCCPSRATFLTGQYAHNHGVRGNLPPEGGFQAFRDRGTLPVALRRAGYRTGYVGRYLNGYDTRRVPRGWSVWAAPVGAQSSFSMYRYTLNEGGRLRSYGRKPSDYQTDVYARKAAAFIRSSARGRAPFFLTLAPLAPHVERRGGAPNPRPAPRHQGTFSGRALPTPPSFNEADVSDKPAFVRSQPRLEARDRRRLGRLYRDRLASLLAVDDAVARILDELRDANELRRTVILFTSDNGYLLGEHRLTEKNRMYEESAGVPLVIRGPRFPGGAVRRQVTGNVDLAPTILDLARARPGRVVDGRSLVPLARRGSAGSGRAILLENQSSTAIRVGRWMYAEHHAKGERELYDLRRDPFQLRSRHADPRLGSTRERLASRLARLRNCAGASCR